MSTRISHSIFDPIIGPRLKSLYPHLHIPAWFPPEGIIGFGHGFAILGAVGFAFSTQTWWGGLLAAAGVIGNHIADCVDGTHARATGQCRNGGELLDHFTDPLSFAYWLVGIGIACGSTELALVAVICLFAIAVLTNIKAKLIGEFTLSRFGPTEFKTVLATFGLSLSALTLLQSGISQQTALIGFASLILLGLIQLPMQLIRAVKEVNRSEVEVDTSEWITGPTAKEKRQPPVIVKVRQDSTETARISSPHHA
jgi:phosphatidylglycerophosphate synthase